MAQSLHFLTPATSPTLKTQTFSKFVLSKSNLSIHQTRKPLSICAISSDLESKSVMTKILGSENGKGGVFEVDAVTEVELKENGFRSTRRTKLVCTIGPTTCGFEQLGALAVGGMNANHTSTSVLVRHFL
ncbi:hypothetical protein MKX03_027586 [Papaver bracteatum]|nr:hypothetical protein MKX03_027586 [Papaver bracteatum]